MDHDSLGRILVDFYVQGLTYLPPHLSLDEVQRLAANAAALAVEYAKGHPYRAALAVASSWLTPSPGAGWLTMQLLQVIGAILDPHYPPQMRTNVLGRYQWRGLARTGARQVHSNG